MKVSHSILALVLAVVAETGRFTSARYPRAFLRLESTAFVENGTAAKNAPSRQGSVDAESGVEEAAAEMANGSRGQEINASRNVSASASANASVNVSAKEVLHDKFMDRVHASVGRTLAKADRALADATHMEAEANHTLAQVAGNESSINATRNAVDVVAGFVNTTVDAHREAREKHRDAREDHRDFREAFKNGTCEAFTPKFSETCPKLTEAKGCSDYEPDCTWVPAVAPEGNASAPEGNPPAPDGNASALKGNASAPKGNASDTA